MPAPPPLAFLHRCPGSLAAGSRQMHLQETLILDCYLGRSQGCLGRLAETECSGFVAAPSKHRSLAWFMESSFPEAASKV